MTTGGDGGIGQANASGIFGNGGSSADGIAVFDVSISKIDSMTVPVDALFYGTAFGSAVNSAGAAGYQLPSTDLYTGGKLQTSSFLVADPGANYIVASGTYSTATKTFSSKRTITTSTTVRGWKEGKAITYAFEIVTGSVKAGDVVYVGGSCMKINGTKLQG